MVIVIRRTYRKGPQCQIQYTDKSQGLKVQNYRWENICSIASWTWKHLKFTSHLPERSYISYNWSSSSAKTSLGWVGMLKLKRTAVKSQAMPSFPVDSGVSVHLSVMNLWLYSLGVQRVHFAHKSSQVLQLQGAGGCHRCIYITRW